jgi:hypothetical protein
MHGKRKPVFLTAFVIAALLAAALLASSCGGKPASTTTTTGLSTQKTGQAEIDNFLDELDRQMSAVPSDSDLNDGQLSDSQLGL